MKPKRKPMFTTLFVCLMAYQAVETQAPALETVQINSSSVKNEQEKNKMIIIVPIKEEGTEEEYKIFNLASKTNHHAEKSSPFRDEEEPPPKPGL